MKKDIKTAPKSMNIGIMRQILMKFMQTNPDFYTSAEFGISAGANFFNKFLEVSDGGPFFVEDYRMGFLIKGELDVTINLIHHRVTAGNMFFVGRGSIATINQVSDDAVVKGFILSADLVNQVFSENKPSLVSNNATTFIHEATADDRRFFDNILLSIWSLVHTDDYPTEVLHSLFAALLNYYDHLLGIQSNLPRKGSSLFNQFIALVNQHSNSERSIAFYADKLCLSPRYFSTLIQEQSGQPAKHWIDTAIVTHAKILLRHTPKTVSQISAELNFPNDSFFCKFFRRLTGLSPSQYREIG